MFMFTLSLDVTAGYLIANRIKGFEAQVALTIAAGAASSIGVDMLMNWIFSRTFTFGITLASSVADSLLNSPIALIALWYFRQKLANNNESLAPSRTSHSGEPAKHYAVLHPLNSHTRVLAALAGGFALSFAGLGVLWVGAAWQYQALMFFPFFLLSFEITRTGDGIDSRFLFVMLGAAPIGTLVTMFRDNIGSHLMPIVVVSCWVAGSLAGHLLASWLRDRASVTPDEH